MRRRYFWCEEQRKWVDYPTKRSPRINIISDQTNPFVSMADGKVYDSKSRYRAELRARGFEEYGNEKSYVKPREWDRPQSAYENDIREAMGELGWN